jgi:hypothetical protein
MSSKGRGHCDSPVAVNIHDTFGVDLHQMSENPLAVYVLADRNANEGKCQES